jgi:hypothetical protein
MRTPTAAAVRRPSRFGTYGARVGGRNDVNLHTGSRARVQSVTARAAAGRAPDVAGVALVAERRRTGTDELMPATPRVT